MALTDSAILWGLRPSAASFNLYVTSNGNPSTLTFGGSLSTTTDYFMSGDTDGATDLLEMLKDCLETHGDITTATVAYDSNFKIAITTSPNSSNIHWSHANTTLDSFATFGFLATDKTTSEDTGDASSHTSRYIPEGIWRPQRPLATDTRDRQPIIGGLSEAISGKVRVSRLATPNKTRDFGWILLPKERALDEYATGPFDAAEYGWVNSISKGHTFRYCADETALGTYSDYRIRSLEEPIERSEQHQILYSVKLMGREV